jgi:N-acetylglucosaminyldiphosphoundecaprenol N-acetyl-beta-D-mannosaminyltransferase
MMTELLTQAATPDTTSTQLLTAPIPCATLMGLDFAQHTYDQVLSHLAQCAKNRIKTLCVTINLDILRLTHQDPDYYQVVKQAGYRFADGMPLVWMSRLTATPLPERVAGCDIVHDVCRLSHQQGLSVFILGAGPGVADTAVSKLKVECPQINVVGTYAPDRPELTNAQASQAIVDRINTHAPDFLLVALGAPVQEKWLAQHWAALNIGVAIPCGGSIDFIAGTQPKAPQWLGRLGVEWLYRLSTNPQKFFDRYVMKDMPFLLTFLTHTLKNR